MRKAARLLAVSFALFALVVFSTVVVSDWDCHSAADDTRCPYCHLTHQGPAPQLVARGVTAFETLASLPLPEDSDPITIPALSEAPPRAPPV